MKKILILQNANHEPPALFGKYLFDKKVGFTIMQAGDDTIYPDPSDFAAVIVMGGPLSVNDDTAHIKNEIEFIKEVVAKEVPYLGVCLGMQLLAKAAGCEIVRAPEKEIAWFDPDGYRYEIRLTEKGQADPLFSRFEESIPVFHLHGDTIVPNAKITILATGARVENQVFRTGKNAYGIQAHLELTKDVLLGWCRIDAWLKARDSEPIIEKYDEFETEYVDHGKRLIENFLGLIQF